MKRIIYIAGPMTGYKNYNKPAFNQAAAKLEEIGWTVLNPASLPLGLTQGGYMDICFAMLRSATAIYMLEEYQESKGALAELAYAEKLELEIYKEGY